MGIAPSILNSNILDIKKSLDLIEESGVKKVHIDLMDGVFVNDMAFGPKFIKDIRSYSNLIFDVHLMIDQPETKIANFLDSGADILTFHIESTNHALDVIQKIKQQNIKAGIAINPATPIENIKPVLSFIDEVIVMTINPGTTNQVFVPEMLEKVELLCKWKKESNYQYDIEVDGKISNENIAQCQEAGANVFVSGGYIFDSINPLKQITKLQDILGIE